MARFYSNENFPLPTVEELRRLGHDVLTSEESGRAGQRIPDREVLDFAVHERRILLTMNRRHFIRLHETNPDHFGIVVCSFDPDFAGLANRIDRTLAAQGDATHQLMRINRPN